jgi:hypothetical protein
LKTINKTPVTEIELFCALAAEDGNVSKTLETILENAYLLEIRMICKVLNVQEMLHTSDEKYQLQEIENSSLISLNNHVGYFPSSSPKRPSASPVPKNSSLQHKQIALSSTKSKSKFEGITLKPSNLKKNCGNQNPELSSVLAGNKVNDKIVSSSPNNRNLSCSGNLTLPSIPSKHLDVSNGDPKPEPKSTRNFEEYGFNSNKLSKLLQPTNSVSVSALSIALKKEVLKQKKVKSLLNRYTRNLSTGAKSILLSGELDDEGRSQNTNYVVSFEAGLSGKKRGKHIHERGIMNIKPGFM